MPDYINEPAFQTIIQSPKVMRLKPEKRQEFLKLLGDLSPQERQQFADGLGSQGAPEPAVPRDRTLEGTTMQDTSSGGMEGMPPEQRAANRASVRGLGADVAGMIVNMALPMTLPARAGNLLRAGVDVGASVLGGKTSQVLQGGSLAPNWSDAVNAAIPAAVHGAAAVYRGSHFLGGRAIRESDAAANAIDTANQEKTANYNTERAGAETAADAANVENQAAYQTKINETRADLTLKSRAAATENQQATADYPKQLQAWKTRNASQAQAEYNDFVQRRDAIQAKTDLSNAQKVSEHQQNLTDYQGRLQAHAQSARVLPTLGDPLAPPVPSETLYGRIQGSPPTPIENARAQATRIITEIDTHLPQFQDSRLRQTAEDLLGSETPDFSTFRKLLSDVGNLKYTSEARDSRYRGLVKQLYGSLRRDLDAVPTTGLAGQDKANLLEANAAFRKEKALEEYRSLFEFTTGPRPQDNAPEVRARAIRTGYQKFKADSLNRGAFTDQEWQNLDRGVQQYTTLAPIGNPPNQQRLATAKLPEEPTVSQFNPRAPKEPMPVNGPEQAPAAYGAPPETVQPKYPNPPKMDTSVPLTPTEALGSFPTGTTVLSGVAGAGIGGLVAEQLGMPTYHGIVAGKIVGAGIAAAPWLIARLRLSGPEGEAIVRNIMAGQSHVDSQKLAALMAAARGRGILKNDGGDQR